MTLDEMRKLALQRLLESREHEEQWDLLFRTPGAAEIIYIPHDEVDSWEFEPEEWGWFGIEKARQSDISNGDLATDAEVDSWKAARAADAIARVSSECGHAFVIPVCDRMIVHGYAVFDGGLMDGDPDFEPSFVDVFLTEEAAYEAMRSLGITA
jgi:hypothetical protein